MAESTGTAVELDRLGDHVMLGIEQGLAVYKACTFTPA